ncbi:MAG TPA: 2-C-methyl-D-erythritol 4-phosphate cytidylyltransferase [Flexivirga sp.]|uniref:2-C-methyl-D-erythritol 4-phosphate cytidylyltransferase n=1 Tax=Flexivirga sp. TaxID=1962927 RepID=UPI002C11B474|nr:2-C-methyl-D-erythritol 4-phosphate cytidylyltransferase [Flexivirga sp.]HWC22215.1 2-C-methyl-D-erythritol 4-phosphate cytidylyltransferase [Flexivirga sp.]
MGVVVVAAGMGVRLRAGMPKALVRVGGRTLVEHAVDAARQSCGSSRAEERSGGARIETGPPAIVVVAPRTHLAEFEALLPGVRVIPGGAERTDSVAAGLAALPDDVDIVLVHDAARALAPPSLFDAVAEAVARGADAVVPGLPVTDTIKQVDAAGAVVQTPDRSTLRAVQTPQGFQRAALEAAHARGGAATDDAMLIERAGGTVQVIDGDPLAMKITLPPDIEAAERLLAPRVSKPATPALVVLGGLPGVGKTTLARALARRIPLAHIRVDTIEATLVHSGMADRITGPEGYAVAFRLAADQLALGLSVVADTVNPLPETRDWWRQVAIQHDARVVEIELTCSDAAVHEARVGERESDIPGLTVPTWHQVLDREYHPWSPDLRLDTATSSPDDLADTVIDWMRSHE